MDASPASAKGRLLYWAGTLTRFLSMQALAQLCAVGAGLLIVRSLGIEEYALYTIALTVQATLTVLADSGVSSVLSAIGGRVCEDRHRFGQLVRTALRFRRVLEAAVLAVMAPVLFLMLRKEGAGWGAAALAAVAIGVGLHFQVATSVLSVVPRLHLQANRLQLRELLSAAVRFGLVALLAWWGAGFVPMIAAATLAFLLQSVLVGRLAWSAVERDAPPHPEDRAEMVRAFKHQLLNGIYYAFQPQITLWVITVFGNATGIAEVGALGRLSAVFTLMAAVLVNIVVPRFARYRSAALLRRRYLQIVGAVVVLGGLLITLSALFPRQILFVLGPRYAHLERELVLMVALAVVSQLAHSMWQLNAARAWIWKVWVNVPMTIAVQVLLVPVLDLSSSRGVIIFGMLSFVPTFVVNVALTVAGLRDTARREREAARPAGGATEVPPLLTGTQP